MPTTYIVTGRDTGHPPLDPAGTLNGLNVGDTFTTTLDGALEAKLLGAGLIAVSPLPTAVTSAGTPDASGKVLTSTASGLNEGEWLTSGGGGGTPAAITTILDTGPGYFLGAVTSVPIAVGDAVSDGVTGHMTTLPIPTAPGGIVSAGLRYLGVPTFAGELQVISVGIGVSNMDRSEGLFVTNMNALADLVSGDVTGTWTDFAAPAFQVGSDLVSDDAGTITSTAGGVFVAEARVTLLWIPA